MLPKKLFKKTVENFVCEKCGTFVEGNGYTNHCTSCLWSKHVDINPGDRRMVSACSGLMQPVSCFGQSGGFSILHQCVACKLERKNFISKEDNFDALVKLSNIYLTQD